MDIETARVKLFLRFSGLSEMRQILKSSCRMHPRVEIRSIEATFSRSCVKFNDPPLGPRERGPSLRAFLLLAALQVVGAFCRVID